MNKNANKILAMLVSIPAIAFANPLARYHDPLFSHEPPCGEGAFPQPGHPGMEFGKHLPPYLQDINLTDTQRNEIEALIQKTQASRQGKEKPEFDHLNIQKQVFSETYSDEKMAGLIKQSSAQHEAYELNRAKLDHAIFEKLTPKQQQQMQSKLTMLAEHFKNLK